MVFDRDMSTAAGALDLLTVQHTVTSLADRLLPPQIFEERSAPRRVLGVLYRAGKVIGLDLPQDHTLLVVGHEIFGHGSRLRELGAGAVRYRIDVPIPYGPGGGRTSFHGELTPTSGTLLAIDVSGIEAQNIMADAIADRAVARGRMHYREAWLYFESRIAGLTYMQTASERSSEGHDVAEFLRTVRDACAPPSCVPVTEKDLKRRAWLILGDPLLYSALQNVFSSYVVTGSAASSVPMIPVGHLRYIPALGFQLTPYGTEWTTRHLLAGGGRTFSLVIRIGDAGTHSSWGVGARAYDLMAWRRWPVSLTADLWRQPSLDAESLGGPLETGGAATITLTLPLPRVVRPAWLRGLQLTGGYKSAGFVPGERLAAGAILRGGVTIEPDF